MTWRKSINQALKRVYTGRHAPKLIAIDAGVSRSAAEQWLSGQTVPSGESLVNLMAMNERLADEVRRIIENKRQAGKCKQKAHSVSPGAGDTDGQQDGRHFALNDHSG